MTPPSPAWRRVIRKSAAATSREHIDYLKARTEPHDNLSLVYLDPAESSCDSSARPWLWPYFFLLLLDCLPEGHDFIDYKIEPSMTLWHQLLRPKNQHVICQFHFNLRQQTQNIYKLERKPVICCVAALYPWQSCKRVWLLAPAQQHSKSRRETLTHSLPRMVRQNGLIPSIALQNLNHYLLKLAHDTPSDEIKTFRIGGWYCLIEIAILHTCKTANRPLRLWATSLLTPQIASYWLGDWWYSMPSNIGRALLAEKKSLQLFIASCVYVEKGLKNLSHSKTWWLLNYSRLWKTTSCVISMRQLRAAFSIWLKLSYSSFLKNNFVLSSFDLAVSFKITSCSF